MELAQVIMLLIIIFTVILFGLIIAYVLVLLKNKQGDKNVNVQTIESKSKIEQKENRGSVYDFMDFEEVKDNMIIRKNRSQYIMVVRCKGGNYDLMSEEEKVSVESGFVKFLNTLKYPIQLYVQTTSLNLRDIIKDYNKRLDEMRNEIKEIEQQIRIAKASGDEKQIERLIFEGRRKENVFEYSRDISEYIERMSMNKNILQQKRYIAISYYASEVDNAENLGKDELDNICFSELYTRTQTIIRTLGSAGVTGKILNSEELSELLYVAYNRDEAEVMEISRAIEAEYDALYSVGKDVLEKRKQVLEEKIDREAIELATESIKQADEKLKNEKKVVKKALEIVDEYKDQMSEELYNQTKKEINSKAKEKEKQEEKKTVKKQKN